jgi:dihydrofolate reductase
MPKVRVLAFSVTADGFSAGPRQDLTNPLGVNGGEMMAWFFPTHTFQTMHGAAGADGTKGVDDRWAAASFQNVGAWILGRNMFGPVRGPWPDDQWKGWWGEEPPYHVPVFVLTHHAREPLAMKGNTTFHFITGGLHEALDRARAAAGDKDVRIGGGVSTVRQYLRERLIDDLHLAQSSALLGEGESLFAGLDWRALGYRCVERHAGENATHLRIERGG